MDRLVIFLTFLLLVVANISTYQICLDNGGFDEYPTCDNSTVPFDECDSITDRCEKIICHYAQMRCNEGCRDWSTMTCCLYSDPAYNDGFYDACYLMGICPPEAYDWTRPSTCPAATLYAIVGFITVI